jgi:hypothetical protein
MVTLLARSQRFPGEISFARVSLTQISFVDGDKGRACPCLRVLDFKTRRPADTRGGSIVREMSTEIVLTKAAALKSVQLAKRGFEQC